MKHDHDREHAREHGHARDHGHRHSHDPAAHTHHGDHHRHSAPADHGRAFVIAIVLNTGFVAVELAYGFIANSTALLADAWHNLSDVLGLLLAWGAAILGRRAPSRRFTYGLGSSSILAAAANAMFLLAVCGALAWEALQRFSQPPAVAGLTVTLVACAGIVVNGLSALLFARASKADLNIRGAYLHMAADAAVSLGVALAGVAMMATGWYWLDPAISLVIVAVIVAGTWEMLRRSLQLALNAVPEHIDVTRVETYLRECPGVTDVHDLHIWGMSTTESALTVHLVMPGGYPGDAFVDEIMLALRERFAVHHSTLQVEQGTTNHCCILHPAAK